ncbi:hypothetical protein INT43_004568 [Umbelopsis isabellina]|uniref:Uncharacterized protein n=1 Tax=Mortierella isabellina TaxID=91625 RepID=A0A8H7PGF3_MORIS|nr:hypothetical protein INT43_004568 [Umbelopsis isabellina]
MEDREMKSIQNFAKVENPGVNLEFDISLQFLLVMPSSEQQPDHENHPTQDPFTSAGKSTGTGCSCLFWTVPLAALGGFLYQVFRKVGSCGSND